MTPRQDRLARLARVRELQHDQSVGLLRAARHRLHAAEGVLQQGRMAQQENRMEQRDALQDGSREAWLMARAEQEAAVMRTVRAVADCISTNHETERAAMVEVSARRDALQAKALLERVHLREGEERDRREQQRLEEVARLLRAHLATGPSR